MVCETDVTTVEYLSVNSWAETFGKKIIFTYTENNKLKRPLTPISYWLQFFIFSTKNIFSSLNFLIMQFDKFILNIVFLKRRYNKSLNKQIKQTKITNAKTVLLISFNQCGSVLFEFLELFLPKLFDPLGHCCAGRWVIKSKGRSNGLYTLFIQRWLNCFRWPCLHWRIITRKSHYYQSYFSFSSTSIAFNFRVDCSVTAGLSSICSHILC